MVVGDVRLVVSDLHSSGVLEGGGHEGVVEVSGVGGDWLAVGGEGGAEGGAVGERGGKGSKRGAIGERGGVGGEGGAVMGEGRAVGEGGDVVPSEPVSAAVHGGGEGQASVEEGSRRRHRLGRGLHRGLHWGLLRGGLRHWDGEGGGEEAQEHDNLHY